MTLRKTVTNLKVRLRIGEPIRCIIVRWRPFYSSSRWWPDFRTWWVVFYYNGEESGSNGPHTYEEAHYNRKLNEDAYKLADAQMREQRIRGE